MPKRIEFSASEIKAMQESPVILSALADYHSVRETEASASEWDSVAEVHRKRRIELEAEADRLDSLYQDDQGPGFDD